MADILPTTLISRTESLLATEVDGETVLMHVERGHYYGLARTAQAIWDLLDTPRTFAELCGLLQLRFSGPATLIEADTRRFVQAMADESLVSLA
jgi:hypothetical protein